MSGPDNPDDFQNSLFRKASENGPCEVLIREERSKSRKFDGSVKGVTDASGTQFGLRVLRRGRVGVSGGSFHPSPDRIARAVAAAESNATTGPRALNFCPPQAKAPHPEFPDSNTTYGEVDLPILKKFILRMEKVNPEVHWSGTITHRHRRYRLVHSNAAERYSWEQGYIVTLRGRGNKDGEPFDRTFTVSGESWAKVVDQCLAYTGILFPHDVNQISFPRGADCLLSPRVTFSISATLKQKSQGRTVHDDIHIIDDPGKRHVGFDAEGVPLRTVEVARGGEPVYQWAGITETTETPSGRGYRPSLDQAPYQHPYGLRWLGDYSSGMSTRQVLLINTPTVQVNGSQITARPTEGIVLEEGVPVGLCSGGRITIDAVDDLSKNLIGYSDQRYPYRQHRLPLLALDNILTRNG